MKIQLMSFSLAGTAGAMCNSSHEQENLNFTFRLLNFTYKPHKRKYNTTSRVCTGIRICFQ